MTRTRASFQVVKNSEEYPEGCEYMVREGDGNDGGHTTVAYVPELEDAVLFAAAPKLLEALKNLLAGPNWPGAQMTARAAIAAAEGRPL